MEQIELDKSLKTRHITMISIGGIIGTGLFIGTGKNIMSTGPATIISYFLACMIIVFIMRMLGEMASTKPENGSFAAYSGRFIGPWAGFTVGWLYWISWVFIVGLEAAVIGGILNSWFPMVPVWVGSVGITVILTGLNLYSVKTFGEFEYWLAFIKVSAIILFLIVGVTMILGINPNFEYKGLGFISDAGGFAPKGILPIFTGIVFVIFSISGAEVAAIAAGESENPKRNIVRAINNVVYRLGLFFVGSVLIMIMIIPWNDTKALAAPYANILKMAGFPLAGEVMQFVIFVSLISVMNSALFTSSRMLLGMAEKGDAPAIFKHVSKRNAPTWAILGSTIVAYICAILYFLSPDVIFYFLGNAVGALMIIVYIFIAIAHIRFRREYERTQTEPLAIKMWLFPYLTYLTIAVLLGVYVCQIFIPSLRAQFYLSTAFFIITIAVFFFKDKKIKAYQLGNPYQHADVDNGTKSQNM
ncbi:amino acid permease [Rummeliibacillus suwonensis]|uniref:amino acid permease n=1 Tax=Rummeliibacillus suwonensis TaxID=1306154 RepID=UPI00289E916E|nr:amino acid permease [Rummeliibacillus suwonensis]